MSRVRARDTQPELLLRRALWAAGIRGWRLHAAKLPGRPDITFVRQRLAIFVDGAFWHGHPDYYRGQSGPFWDAKIEQNRERDRRVNAELELLGWRTLRFWDFEVEKELTSCVRRIETALRLGALA
jgi:DNA mismatch endonuclease (patch repair protein)